MSDKKEQNEYPYFDYIDTSIPLPEKIPKYIDNIINTCEGLALMGDDLYYVWAEHLDVACKNAYAAGVITKKDWDLLVRRYHL